MASGFGWPWAVYSAMAALRSKAARSTPKPCGRGSVGAVQAPGGHRCLRLRAEAHGRASKKTAGRRRRTRRAEEAARRGFLPRRGCRAGAAPKGGRRGGATWSRGGRRAPNRPPGRGRGRRAEQTARGRGAGCCSKKARTAGGLGMPARKKNPPAAGAALHCARCRKQTSCRGRGGCSAEGKARRLAYSQEIISERHLNDLAIDAQDARAVPAKRCSSSVACAASAKAAAPPVAWVASRLTSR